MPHVGGFWSYVHADDATEGGRITRLGRDLVAKYEMLTGDSIDLFLDRDDIAWGDRWREVADTSLANVAFFIPVLTPRYFQSVECRRELQLFARKTRDLGIRELVMPIKYVHVPGLDEDEPDDDLVVLVKEFQWENWTDLAYADPESEAYRRGVGRLAERLVEANRAAESADVAASVEESASEAGSEAEDEPGVLDRMAEAERALPEWTQTLIQIGAEIEEIGAMMESSTEEMEAREARGAGFAGRLQVARETAGRLEPHAQRILELSNEFTNQLHSVDGGIRAIIEAAPTEVSDDPTQREQACSFFENMAEMASSSRDGLGSIQEMLQALEPVERVSRDLRAPVRKLRKGLTVLHEGRAVAEGWLRLIDESPLECPPTS